MIALVGGILVLPLAVLWLFTIWETRRIDRHFPPRGVRLRIDDLDLHYLEAMPDGSVKATVLLLHGASGNAADVMLPLGQSLAAEGCRVIAVDRPGHGWSERPRSEAEASPAHQAKLIVGLLQALGVDDALVVGHSWSGALAVHLALAYRATVRGLVLLAPVLYPWPGGVSWYYGLAGHRLLGWPFTHALTLPLGLLLVGAGAREVFWPQPPPEGFLQRTGVALLLRPAQFLANARDVLGLHRFVSAQMPMLGSIAVPTTIIVGDEDKVVAAEAQGVRASAAIPGATLLHLSGVGHSPHWAAPDLVVPAVRDLLGRHAEARKEDEAAA